MNTLYNEFVEESVATESSFEKLSLKLDRLMLAYESVCRKEELDIREAEIRCMEESGDMDLLESYYIEASEGNSEKKEGLLKQIWETIKEFFRKIKNFFLGSDQRKRTEEAAQNNEETEVTKEDMSMFEKVKAYFSSFLEKVKSIPSKLKKGISEMDAKAKVASILGVGAITGLTIFAVKKKDKNGNNLVKIKAQDILNFLKDKSDPIFEKIDPVIDEIKEKIKDNVVVKAVKNGIQEALDKIKQVLKSVLGLFGSGSSKKDETTNEGNNSDGSINKETARQQNNNNRRVSSEDEKAFMSKSQLEKYDPKAYNEYTKKRQDLETKLRNANKSLSGDKLAQAKKKYEEDKRALNSEYMVNLNEHVELESDYELPDEFIEESVYDESINEISTLLDTL